jgi:hypothetical protein
MGMSFSVLVESEEHCRALGLITANFAMLEYRTAALVWSQLAVEGRVGQIVTAELSYARLRGLLSSLVKENVADEEARKACAEWLARAAAAEQKRNLDIHSLWMRSADGQAMYRLKVTAKERRGLVHQQEAVTVEDLLGVANFIAEVVADITEIVFKMNGGNRELPPLLSH